MSGFRHPIVSGASWLYSTGGGVGVKVGRGVLVTVALGAGEAEGETVTIIVEDGVGVAQAVSRTSKRKIKGVCFMGGLLSWRIILPGV